MKFPCPICQKELTSEFGQGQLNSGNPEFGITLFCNEKDCKIEVFGHTSSKKPEEAYEIIKDRFKFAKNNTKSMSKS